MNKILERAQHAYEKAAHKLQTLMCNEFPEGAEVCLRHYPDRKGTVVGRSYLYPDCLLVQEKGALGSNRIGHLRWSSLKHVEKGEENEQPKTD